MLECECTRVELGVWLKVVVDVLLYVSQECDRRNTTTTAKETRPVHTLAEGCIIYMT